MEGHLRKLSHSLIQILRYPSLPYWLFLLHYRWHIFWWWSDLGIAIRYLHQISRHMCTKYSLIYFWIKLCKIYTQMTWDTYIPLKLNAKLLAIFLQNLVGWYHNSLSFIFSLLQYVTTLLSTHSLYCRLQSKILNLTWLKPSFVSEWIKLILLQLSP